MDNFTKSLPRKGMESFQHYLLLLVEGYALQTHCPERGWKLWIADKLATDRLQFP
ncbi:hypothetical protein [Nostoc sp.]